MNPKNNTTYGLCSGCHDCLHGFLRTEYDDLDTYYCTLNTPRPKLCFSVHMDEIPEEESDVKNYGKLSREWHAWADENLVEPWGYCLEWKPKLKDEES